MEKTLAVLNELETVGLIRRYAIGGAVALLFYTEPVVTYDLDAFCLLPTETGPLITLSPIYEYLQQQGWPAQQEHILIAGIPVQLIPAYNDLVVEAVTMAPEQSFKQTRTRVLLYEHLLAIMLQTGRPKDRLRLLQSLEERQPDGPVLQEILGRHGLMAAWQERSR